VTLITSVGKDKAIVIHLDSYPELASVGKVQTHRDEKQKQAPTDQYKEIARIVLTEADNQQGQANQDR
jgi:hypothetical protein